MKRFLMLSVMVVGCEALSTPSPREEIKMSLSGYEGLDPSWFRDLHGDVVESLIAISEDESEKRFYRSRALFALGQYPEERVLRFFSRWPYERDPFLALDALSVLAESFDQPELVQEKLLLVSQPDLPAIQERFVELKMATLASRQGQRQR